jgi:hypothetical protein
MSSRVTLATSSASHLSTSRSCKHLQGEENGKRELTLPGDTVGVVPSPARDPATSNPTHSHPATRMEEGLCSSKGNDARQMRTANDVEFAGSILGHHSIAVHD